MPNTQIFTRFQASDVVPNQEEQVTRALFSGNDGNLTTMHTSSNQTAAQQDYYYEIFNSASSAVGAQAQFSVAYGHALGSGSLDSGGQVNDTPSKAVYGQYKQICLEPGDSRFTIGGSDVDDIYVINVNRARLKESLDVGSLEINLAQLSGSQFVAGGGSAAAHTGSNVVLAGDDSVIRLIDNSKTAAATVTQAGDVYDIVSGSIEDGIYTPTTPVYYGKVFKNLGIVVLSADMLDASASFGTVEASETDGDNAFKLFTAMSGAADLTDASGDALGLQARSSEKVKSTHYFVRIRSGQYNFSNNPSYTTGSEGDLAQPTFIGNPVSYISTVGMYNDNFELVAVAKLSKPIKKSFTEEALIKVKLDY
jgi:hypothetical protein